MKKRPKRKPKGLRSDGSNLPSTVAPMALSGQYIALAQTGNLEKVRRLRKELGKLLLEQEKITRDLKGCNEHDWLDKFAATMQRRGKNFESALREFIGTREKKKQKIEDRVEAIRQELEALDSSFVGQPLTTLAAPVTELSPHYAEIIPKTGPNSRFDVTQRDAVIYRYRKLSAMKICSKLDLELIRRDGAPAGFPENWQEKYGVSTFSAAYKNADCRPLVQTLISKARTGA